MSATGDVVKTRAGETPAPRAARAPGGRPGALPRGPGRTPGQAPRHAPGPAAVRLACVAALLALAGGCRHEGGAAAVKSAPPCTRAAVVARLAPALRESSGLAASRRHPGILWTHDDSGGEPVVYAIDGAGRLRGSVRVTGARARDWEDIALGPCAAGDCLYIGDIGDNGSVRSEIDIYRVPEPAPGEARTAPAERLSVSYPDGPRDAEALYVLPDGAIYIVSKGRRSPVALYRVPAGAAPGRSLRLARVQQLSPSGSESYGLVTAADASADGRLVAIRTYERLRFYRPGAGGRLAPVSGGDVPLEDAREPQGEAVAFGRGDTIWLSSEAGPMGGSALLGRIDCSAGKLGGQSVR